MSRYFMSWEIVRERLPEDPKTIAKGWDGLLGMVKQDLETGKLKDWGAFPGDLRGYSILEGNEVDVMAFTIRYAPHVKFSVHPLANVREVAEFLKGATK